MEDEDETDTVLNLRGQDVMAKLLEAKASMLIGNLSFAQVKSRAGLPDWRINTVFDGLMTDYQMLNARGNSGDMLKNIQAQLSGSDVQTDARVVKLEESQSKIIRSLDSIHHRLDALNQQPTP